MLTGIVLQCPQGVVGILPDKATFKPGASTWNTDMAPDSHVKKARAAAHGRTDGRVVREYPSRGDALRVSLVVFLN